MAAAAILNFICRS